MSRARRQQYMLRTEKCSSHETTGSKGRSARSAPSSAKRTVCKFVHRNEVRRWEASKGTERILKTGSRLWKLRCCLLQPRDRAKSDRRLCNTKNRRDNAD